MESMLTRSVTRDEPRTVAETALASKVLQGLSAVYLLLKASRDAPMHEIDAALKRIGAWLQELDDSIASVNCGTDQRLTIVASSLRRAFGELHHAAHPAVADDQIRRTAAAAYHIAEAASLMQRLQDVTDNRAGFVASCCAADIQHIAETRNYS